MIFNMKSMELNIMECNIRDVAVCKQHLFRKISRISYSKLITERSKNYEKKSHYNHDIFHIYLYNELCHTELVHE